MLLLGVSRLEEFSKDNQIIKVSWIIKVLD